MSANYVRGSTVADFLQGTATGKNVGQSLKADCGELAARALLARFVLRNAVTSTEGVMQFTEMRRHYCVLIRLFVSLLWFLRATSHQHQADADMDVA